MSREVRDLIEFAFQGRSKITSTLLYYLIKCWRGTGNRGTVRDRIYWDGNVLGAAAGRRSCLNTTGRR